VLVEEGGADISVQDRWGYTPLAEAQRVGATQVVEYLDRATAAAAALRRHEADTQADAARTNSSSSTAVETPYQQQQKEGVRSNGVSGGKAKASPVNRQHLQMQLQEEAEAELKRQQLLQAQQVRREVRSSMMRATRIEAVGQLLMLAEQAQEALVVKAEEIDQELALANEARAAMREGQLAGDDVELAVAVEQVGGDGDAVFDETAAADDGDESRGGGNGATQSASSSSSNNVVSATKLQQLHPAAAASTKRRGV
jgi:hypothetical protein